MNGMEPRDILDLKARVKQLERELAPAREKIKSLEYYAPTTPKGKEARLRRLAVLTTIALPLEASFLEAQGELEVRMVDFLADGK